MNYIKEVAIDDLESTEFQRTPNLKFIKNIIDNFDERKVGAVVISERDGHKYVIDGQHRILAIKEINNKNIKSKKIKAIQAVVYNDLTLPEEARLFVELTKGRNAMKSLELYKALLIAKEPEYVDIERIISNYNLSVSNSTTYGITAVGVLVHVYRVYGGVVLDTIINILINAYSGERHSLNEVTLKGIAYVLGNISSIDRLLFINNAAEKLMGIPVRQLLANAKYNMSLTKFGSTKSYGVTILDQYNKGLRSRKIYLKNM